MPCSGHSANAAILCSVDMQVDYDHWQDKLMGATGPKRRSDAKRPPRGKVAAGRAGSNGRAHVAREGSMTKRVFDIPSDFSACRDVQKHIMSDVQASGFGEEDMFAIRISLEEAIVNAIRHGNRLDAAKRVKIESEIGPGHVEIMVEDEGIGFDRQAVPDPTAAENLCRPSGRGILLIESYMTKVNWEAGGKRMRMLKKG